MIVIALCVCVCVQVLTETSIKLAIELLLLSAHPYVHTHTDTHTHRHTQTRTHRDRHTHTDTRTHRISGSFIMSVSIHTYLVTSYNYGCVSTNRYSYSYYWLSTIRYPILSPIIVMIWNVVFSNKSRKLWWIWMKLGRWGWGPEKTKPCTFPAKSQYGFRRELKKMGRRGVVFLSCERR